MAEEEARFSARDVQEVAGLSYRQINDWDGRGALPHDREGKGTWRRYTPKELFILLICAELRREFGVPLKRLDYVRDFMSQEGANHLLAAARLMSMLGVGVWLMTDLEETFIMDSELEFLDLMTHGFFGGDDQSAYLFLKVNPLVNRLLEALTDVEPIETNGRGYEILRQTRGTLLSREEAFVVESLRRREFSRVEVMLDNGEIKTIRTSEKHDASQELQSLLRQHGYQKLTVVQRDGRVVSIEQQATHKAED